MEVVRPSTRRPSAAAQDEVLFIVPYSMPLILSRAPLARESKDARCLSTSARDARLDDLDSRIEAEAVGELRGLVDVPDNEVGLLAGFERAETVGEAEGAGGVAGDAGERLLGRHAE